MFLSSTLLTVLLFKYLEIYFFIEGSFTDDLHFEYGSKTGSWDSCSALFKGKMMIFGGAYWKDFTKQISQVSGCKLERIGQFATSVYQPACNTYNRNYEQVWICFNQENKNGCQVFVEL